MGSVAVGLRAAATRFGTPVFVTDVRAIDDAARTMRAAYPDPWQRTFSLKANDVTGIVRLLGERGFGANVVSSGEWAIARRAGLPNDRITLAGVGKTDRDLRAAVVAARDGEPLRWVAIESRDEALALQRLGGRLPAGQSLDVLVRLNPDVSAETLPDLAVGAGVSKFGMTETELSETVAQLGAGSPLRPRGIHLHVGSQLGAVDAWRDGIRRALALLALLRGGLPDFDTLDLGGGFPVLPPGDPAPDPARFAREIPDLLDAVPADRRPARLAIEPGRALVARAGWLVARVLHVRERAGRQVILDAGMTELIRPALYGARHDIVALTSLGQALQSDGDPRNAPAQDAKPTAVEGPICESTDHLGQHLLPILQRGDLVAIGDAGAYGASMGSTYNGRPRPPQVLLQPDGRLELIRRRGSTASLG
jgi:diaminopimelate decarboxylase